MWTSKLGGESFELPERLLDLPGTLLDTLIASSTRLVCSGGVPETLQERPGRSRGALRNPLKGPRESSGALFGAVSVAKVGAEAETVKCSKIIFDVFNFF